MADESTTPTIPDSPPVVTGEETPLEPVVKETDPAPVEPTEPKAEATPAVELSVEEKSAGYNAIAEAGVDMSSEAVQDAILEGASGDDLIEKFGTKEPEPAAKQDDDLGIKVGKKARLTIETEEDAAIMSIKRAKNITLAEAARIYADQASAQPAEAAKVEPTAPAVDPKVEAFDTQLSEGTTAIDALKAEIKTARDELEFDQAMELTEKLTTLQIQQARTEDKRDHYVENQANQAQATFDTEFSASSQRAMAKFPALEAEDSMERLAFDAFNEKEAEANPEIYDDPNWPEIQSEKFSAKHGLSATSPAASEDGTKPKPAQPRPATPQARRTSRTELLDGGKGGSEAPTPADESTNPLTDASIDEIMEQRANMSQADREAFDAEMHKSAKR